MEDAVAHLDTFWIFAPFESLDISSVWKAQLCVCGWSSNACFERVRVSCTKTFVPMQTRTAFVPNTKSVLLQHKTRSSPVWYRIRRWAETILSLAINLFVFYLEVCLETHQKEQRLGEKRFWKTSFQICMMHGSAKSTETRQGWEKLKSLTPCITERCQPPLWPPTQGTCISIAFFLVCNNAN